MNDTPPKSSAFLSPADLPRLKAQGLSVPAYARAGLKPGVVHLGLGAFHRAHQALVFDRLLASGDTRWGIFGVAMRSTATQNGADISRSRVSVMSSAT
jgi:fructuronate reductase